jgi:hypothetical protein
MHCWLFITLFSFRIPFQRQPCIVHAEWLGWWSGVWVSLVWLSKCIILGYFLCRSDQEESVLSRKGSHYSSEDEAFNWVCMDFSPWIIPLCK